MHPTVACVWVHQKVNVYQYLLDKTVCCIDCECVHLSQTINNLTKH